MRNRKSVRMKVVVCLRPLKGVSYFDLQLRRRCSVSHNLRREGRYLGGEGEGMSMGGRRGGRCQALLRHCLPISFVLASSLLPQNNTNNVTIQNMEKERKVSLSLVGKPDSQSVTDSRVRRLNCPFLPAL